jgi:hypothetical protein
VDTGRFACSSHGRTWASITTNAEQANGCSVKPLGALAHIGRRSDNDRIRVRHYPGVALASSGTVGVWRVGPNRQDARPEYQPHGGLLDR